MSTQPGQPQPPDPPPDPGRWFGLAGIGTGVFMFTLDASIVNVALPTLAQAFGASLAAVQWVPLAYLLVITTLVMGAARLGDVHGRKRAYLSGMTLFIAASALCGLAPGVGWLIAFRALQGLGGVFISALGAAIIAQIFPPGERGRALGVIASCVTLGVALGPTVGALIIDLAGWRWMFLVNIPVGIAAMSIVARVVPDFEPAPARLPFDWLGTLLVAAALASFALALTFGQRQGFGAGLPLALLALALAALLAFVLTETRVDGPILELALFANPAFSAGLAMSCLAFTVLGAVSFTLPFFLQLGLGLPIATVGLLMAISPVIGGIMGPIGGALSDRFGPRWGAVVGLTLMTLGCILLMALDDSASIPRFALSVAPIGLGMGFFNSANNSAVLNAVPRARLGIASGLLSLARTLGQSTGVPVAASLLVIFALGHAGAMDHAALLDLPPISLVRGTSGAFAAAAVAGFLGLCVAVWMLAYEGKTRPPA